MNGLKNTTVRSLDSLLHIVCLTDEPAMTPVGIGIVTRQIAGLHVPRVVASVAEEWIQVLGFDARVSTSRMPCLVLPVLAAPQQCTS